MLSLLLLASMAGQVDCAADQTSAIQAALWARLDETTPTDPQRFQRPPTVDLELRDCAVYKLSRTLHAHNARIRCAPGTILQWSRPVTGLIGHHADVWTGTGYSIGTAHGWGLDGTAAEGFGGGVLEVDNCELRGAGRTATSTASAIAGKVRTVLRNVTIRKWPGNGVDLDCDVNRSPGKSNCSAARLDNVAVHEVGGHALYVDGGDSNAHTVVGFSATYYLGWCVYASGFLGSSYLGLMCHGLTSEADGAILSDSINARSVFSGYVEGPQLVDVVSPSYVVALQGGLPSANTLIVGPWTTGTQRYRPAAAGYGTPYSMRWPSNEQGGTTATAEYWTTGGDALRLRHSTGLGWLLDLQAFGGYRPIVITDRTSPHPRGKLWLAQGWLEGPQGALVQHGAGAPALAAEALPLGSRWVRTDPVLGEPIEWVVVTSSTGAVWVPR